MDIILVRDIVINMNVRCWVDSLIFDFDEYFNFGMMLFVILSVVFMMFIFGLFLWFLLIFGCFDGGKLYWFLFLLGIGIFEILECE